LAKLCWIDHRVAGARTGALEIAPTPVQNTAGQ
jgi:hypothetical protein